LRLLISCYEPKGYGGAATVAYEMFSTYHEMGINAGYLNIIRDFDTDYFRYKYGANFANPEQLENVFTSFIEREHYYEPQPAVIREVDKFKPDVILSIHYIAPLVLKMSIPDIPLIYLTAGCKQAQEYLEKDGKLDANSLLRYLQELEWPPRIYNHEEKRAAELADVVVTHSVQTKQFYHLFFSNIEGKIHNRVFWLHHLITKHVDKFQAFSKPFFDREIDVLFVSNDWSRIEKNYTFVAAIAACLYGTNIHIVGEVPYTIQGVSHHGIISNLGVLYNVMGNSKTIVSPSRLDAAPGILSEGIAMGCNIVASRNCGNWELCNPNLLVEDFTPQGFTEKIKTSLDSKLPDNSVDFGTNADILDLLDLLKLIREI
jgi:hypothetical protein